LQDSRLPDAGDRRNRISEGVEMTVTVNPDLPGHTDLMHRRIALDLVATYQWSGLSFRIETNSVVILQAATKAGFTPLCHSGHRIDCHWEIVIENASGDSEVSPSLQTFRDEQMVMIESGKHHWFALDLETGDGAGFCEIDGTEEAIVTYFQGVTGVIRPWLQNRRPEAASSE
jgi:hypothetical protein